MSLAALALMFQAVTAAPDHVVVMTTDPPGYPAEVERHTITRHGVRIRDEFVRQGVSVVTYTNEATGVTITVGREASGRPQSLSINLQRPGRSPYTFSSAPTARRERVLGETCTIWRTVGTNPRFRMPVTESCRTADGIQLWTRTLYSSSGDVMQSTSAQSLRRRAVSDAEMRPPVELFRWSTWTQLYPAALQPAPNDEVVLQGNARGGPETLVLRRYGAASSEESRSRQGRSLTIFTGALGVQYATNEDEARFSIWPRPVQQDRAVAQEERGNVLGHPCRWYDTWPGVSDAGRWDCRTPDGASLAIRQSSWGRMWGLTATQYRRGVLTAASFTPPPEAFVWNY